MRDVISDELAVAGILSSTRLTATLAALFAVVTFFKLRRREDHLKSETCEARACVCTLDTRRCFVGAPPTGAGERCKSAPMKEFHLAVRYARLPPSASMERLLSWFGLLSRAVDRVDFEELTGCSYTPYLIFEREAGLRSIEFWAMPPPCSPSTPWGSVPAASAAGCAREIASNVWPLLEQLVVCPADYEYPLANRAQPHTKTAKIDPASDAGARTHSVGLGVFALAPIDSGLALCEYTGLVRRTACESVQSRV